MRYGKESQDFRETSESEEPSSGGEGGPPSIVIVQVTMGITRRVQWAYGPPGPYEK